MFSYRLKNLDYQMKMTKQVEIISSLNNGDMMLMQKHFTLRNSHPKHCLKVPIKILSSINSEASKIKSLLSLRIDSFLRMP
jgi:hypothetical protein